MGRRKRQDPAFHNLKRVDNQCVSYDIELSITNLDGSANEYRRDFRSHGQSFQANNTFRKRSKKAKAFHMSMCRGDALQPRSTESTALRLDDTKGKGA